MPFSQMASNDGLRSRSLCPDHARWIRRKLVVEIAPSERRRNNHEILMKPFYWDKTSHGYHDESHEPPVVTPEQVI